MGPSLLLLIPLSLLHCGTLGILVQPIDPDLENYLEDSIDDVDALIPLEIDDDVAKPNLTGKIDDLDKIPIVTSGYDQTEVTFKNPISSVSIDYSRNAILLRFQKNRQKFRNELTAEEAAKRKAFESNFMRFGKREKEDLPTIHNNNDYDNNEDIYDNDDYAVERHERSLGRNARGDNFMRFGRAPAADFMRFGRSPKYDFMRLGRKPDADFMRFGRAPAADFMRFGRAGNNDNFIRFGRSPKSDFMRLGRTPGSNFMRLGRVPKADFMRLGRSSKLNFMRLGRSPATNFLRFGRNQKKTTRDTDKNFMRGENYFRFGRSPSDRTESSQNFMRFGKRSNDSLKPTETDPLLKKAEILETAKVLHKSEEGGDESNPIDKAIKVLYKKHKQEADVKSQERKSSEDMSSLEENDTSYGLAD